MVEKIGQEDLIRSVLYEMELKDIMTKNVVTVHPDDPFSMVEEKMRVHTIRHLPVVTAGNKIVGVVTERDLFRTRSPRVHPDGTRYYLKETLDDFILEFVMTQNPFTLLLNASVAEAIFVMADKKIGCVPVVNEKNILKGIVTRYDFIKIVARILKSRKP